RSIPIYAALQLIADAERDSPDYHAHPEPVEGSPRPDGLPSLAGGRGFGVEGGDHPFQKRTAGALLRFLGLLNEQIALSKSASLSELLDTIIERTGYREHLFGQEG